MARTGLSTAIATLLVTLSATFFLIELAPGDPALTAAAPRVDAQRLDGLRAAWGIDRGPMHRWASWIGAAARGDLGTSWRDGRPVVTVLRERSGTTFRLSATALLIEITAATALAATSARLGGSALGRVIKAGAMATYAIPTLILSVAALALLGPVHDDRFSLVPPSILALAAVGGTIRLLGNAWLDALPPEAVSAYRARGLPRRRILWIHGLPRAAAPVLAAIGVSMPLLLGGALVVEEVFSVPGVGRLFLDAARARDLPVLLGVTLWSGTAVAIAAGLADYGRQRLDPSARD